ncbi:MAG: ANTAR domain-containing protein [Ruminococcus sp.]|nr:ANTAR domain-containing protein [Ruminococcus sp.]
MESVLIVSGNEKATNALVPMLREFGHISISSAKSASEAKRAILSNDYDLVMINAPLSDEYGFELAGQVLSNSLSSCLFIVKAEHFESASAKLEGLGGLCISKPVNRLMFIQALRWISATRNRLLGLKQENIKLQNKIEEMRIVNRAKFALMQYLGFDEAQAHRYIEKQAMDKRVTKYQIATQIIKTYEN